MIADLIITSLNASTYTAVVIPRACLAFGFWTEDGTSYYLNTLDSDTGAGLVPENFPINMRAPQAKNAEVLYAKAVSGTPNLIMIITE